jgi:exonuclease SbcD
MENYGRLDPATGTSSRVRDFLDRMDEVIDFAIRGEADLTVFAGDAFKHRDPEPTQQREFAQRIKRLADHMPVLLLVGNHDMPGQAARASSVDIFQALQVPGVIVGSKSEGRVLDTRRGPLFLAWLPYPMRNRLLSDPEHAGKSIDELESALRTHAVDILADLARQAAGHAMPRLLAAHLSASEARVGSERLVMLGKDVSLSTSALADPVWDYVALGHIHCHQEINHGRPPAVVYSGSLERIDFGEEDEPKGFCWVQLARGQTTWEFVPVAARPFRTIRADVRHAEDPTHAILSELAKVDVAGAVVRVVITLRADQAAAVRDREILPALSAAANVSLYRQIEDEVRTRLGHENPESLTPIELLEGFFRLRGEDDERRRALVALAGEILAADVQAGEAPSSTEG